MNYDYKFNTCITNFIYFLFFSNIEYVVANTVLAMHQMRHWCQEMLSFTGIHCLWRTPMGRMTATIRDIDPERNPILRLDHIDCLSKTQQVQLIKVIQPNGTLVDNVNAKF
jgi:hypothetical protein